MSRRRIGVGAVAKEIFAYAGHALLFPVGAGDDPASPPDEGARTILFVHGLLATASVLRPMREYLARRGHERLVSFAHRGTDVEGIARGLEDCVAARIPTGRIDVVAHSLGGLAVRLWLQERGGAARVDRCILLGVPHRGTRSARFVPFSSLHPLRPGSPLFDRLASGLSRAEAVRYTSVVAEADFMVRPPESAALEVGEVHRLDLGHNGLLFSPRVFRILADALERG